MFTLKIINIPQVSYGWWARIRWPTDWYEPLQYYQDYAWEFRSGLCPPFEATVTFVKAPIDWNLVEIEIASEAWGPVVDQYGTRYGYFPAIIPMRSYTFQEGATYIADLSTLALYREGAYVFPLSSTKLAKLILRNPNPVDLGCHLRFHVGSQTWESWWTFKANSEDTTTWLIAMSTFGVGTFPVYVEVYDTAGNLLLRQQAPDITVV